MNITESRARGQRALSLALAAILSCSAGAVALDSAEQADVARGEDGSEYITASAADDGAAMREQWQERKVHPSVSQKAFAEEEVRVLIYIYDDQTTGQSRVSSTKAQFKSELNDIANDIRDIERKYRPEHSLPPEEEAQIVDGMMAKLSDADSARLAQLRLDADAKMDEMRQAIDAQMPSRVDQTGGDVLRLIQNAGGTIHAKVPFMNAVSATVNSALLNQLAKLDSVATVMLDPEQDLELNISVPSVGFPTWWNGATAFDGGAYDVAVIDSGVQQNHPNLAPAAFYTNSGSTADGDGHGTHVAGIIASTHATHRGGAFGLDALIWARSGNQSLTMNNMHWAAAGAVQSPEAVNHSLGYGVANVDDYNANDSFYDAYIQTYDISVAKSAGNSGWSNTAPTITHPAPAYNLLAVANMDDRDTMSRADDVRSSSSSVGPTVSGRRKPDISAPGTDIISTNNSWAGGASGNSDPNCWNDAARNGDNFMRCSGTSMAAPHVAAAGVLLNDGGVFDPMAQKAVLINTADAWTSNNTSTTSDDGPVTGSLWDKSYGWGYLDMSESHFNRGDYFLDTVTPRNDTNVPNDYKLYRGVMFGGEKATLVWQKRAGTYVAGLPSQNRYGLSDLNLRLYNNDTGVVVDSDLDANDNVHQVDADAPTDAIIKVYAWSTSFSGTGSEPYALATEENFAEVAPPSFSRAYSRPNWVGPNQTFDITVHMDNNGGAGAHDNTVGLGNIAGLTVNGGVNRSVPSIEPGGRQSTVYSISTSGLATGTQWIPLQFISNSYAESYSYSTALGVSLNVENTPPTSSCTNAPAYSNGGTIGVSFTSSDTQTGVRRNFLYVRTPGSGSYGYTGLASNSVSGTFNFTAAAGDGTYQFAVRSQDNGGTYEASPSSSECSTFVDTKKPASTVDSPAQDTSGSVPLTFSVVDPSPSSGLSFVDFWYREDAVESWTYTGEFSSSLNGVVNFTPPTDGKYHFFSRAKDNASNIEAYQAPTSTGDTTTVYDTLPPSGSVLINANAVTTTSTDVTLNLDATDAASGVAQMRFSNNNATWSALQPYATMVNDYDLTSLGGNAGTGIKKVYVQFVDGVGRYSVVYTDTIELVDGVDTDGDGVLDSADNCTLVANADQRDTNGDGYGNICDADLNNDGVVNPVDLGLFRAVFFQGGDLDADFNGDGVVNATDLGIIRTLFFQPPGPSGIAP
ncbi:MAG: S8 family serine peptidase [Gammaproteobacteria bacterium]